MSNWPAYYKHHANRKPLAQLVRAVEVCPGKEHALDLGSGNLIESAYLLEKGFNMVTAVDSMAETREFVEGFPPERFSLEIVPFDAFDFSSRQFDLVNAQYALPFHGPKNFEEFMKKVTGSIKPEGIFVGQLFGIRDGWNTENTELAFQDKDTALALLSGFDLLEFVEEENDSRTAIGNAKHWHLFHFIAQKKA